MANVDVDPVHEIAESGIQDEDDGGAGGGLFDQSDTGETSDGGGAQIVAAVLRPRTFAPSLRMTPPARKPTPVTTLATTRRSFTPNDGRDRGVQGRGGGNERAGLQAGGAMSEFALEPDQESQSGPDRQTQHEPRADDVVRVKFS